MAVSATPSTNPPSVKSALAASPRPALWQGLAGWLRSHLDRRTVTLSVEADAVRLVVLQGRRVVRWDAAPLPSGIVRDGAIEHPEALGAAVRALLAPDGLEHSRRILLGIPGGRAMLRMLTLPDVKRGILQDAVPRLARTEIPVPLEHVHLFWQAFPAQGGQKTIFLMGVLRDVLGSYLHPLQGLGLQLRFVDVRPVALARAANRAKAVIADVSPAGFDIVVVVAGLPVLVRSLSLPQQAAPSKEWATHILEELKRTIQFYEGGQRSGVSLRDAPLVLMGGLASDPVLKDFLQTGLGLPVEPARIPVDCPPEFPVAEYTANLGLALREMPQGASAARLNLNLLPAELRPRPFPLKRVGIGFALAAAVALLVPVVQFKATLDEDVARLTRLRGALAQELKAYRQTLADTRAAEERIQKVNTEAEGLAKEFQSFVGRRGTFSALLETVVSTTPPQVRPVTAREETGKEVTVSGVADSYESVLEYARILESTHRFKRVLVDSMGRKGGPREVTFILRLVLP